MGTLRPDMDARAFQTLVVAMLAGFICWLLVFY